MQLKCPRCQGSAPVDMSVVPARARCKGCGLVWVSDEPVPMMNRRVHDRWSTDDEGWCAELGAWIYRSPSGEVFTVPGVDSVS